MNRSVVSIETLKNDIAKATGILCGVVDLMATSTIVQTVSEPEPPKKTGKKRGRKAGSKNKTAEAPPPTGD